MQSTLTYKNLAVNFHAENNEFHVSVMGLRIHPDGEKDVRIFRAYVITLPKLFSDFLVWHKTPFDVLPSVEELEQLSRQQAFWLNYDQERLIARLILKSE